MTQADTAGSSDRQDRRDILIARIVDGHASAEDWRELRTIAAEDQSIWSELAEEQELTRELVDVVTLAGDIAERVELPTHEQTRHAPGRRLRLVGVAGGWVAAAGLTLAWMTGTLTGTMTSTNASPSGTASGAQAGAQAGSMQTAGIISPINSAAEALAKYLELGKESGEVIGELPQSLVLDRMPNPEGGYDVVYLRQIVEKTTVDDIYEPATTDAGDLVIVPKNEPTPIPAAW